MDSFPGYLLTGAIALLIANIVFVVGSDKFALMEKLRLVTAERDDLLEKVDLLTKEKVALLEKLAMLNTEKPDLKKDVKFETHERQQSYEPERHVIRLDSSPDAKEKFK